MNPRIMLVAGVAIALASCSTAYRTGQTPDDVYYSKGPQVESYVKTSSESQDRYYEDPDDHYLRMMVRNRSRWSTFNDYNSYDWRYNYNNVYTNPWAFNSYNSFNSFWTWNSWYNPYCSRTVILNPKTNRAEFNKLRNFNSTAYTNKNYYNPNRNVKTRSSFYVRPSASGYNNSNSNNTNLGSSIKKVFGGSSGSKSSYYNGGNSGNDRPTRSYTPSSSNSSSSGSSGGSKSGGSSGGGGGVSRPGRG